MNTLKLAIIATLFLLTGCYPGISGKVVDGVTGNPIQGAVVLAQWTTTGGLPGLTHHSVYKITETETDMEGMFSLPGVYYPLVNQPELIIYKKGYVPWRNDMNFMDPDWKDYKKHIWQNDMTYRLEIFKSEYSKNRLNGFLDGGIIGINQTVPKFQKAVSDVGREAMEEIKKNKKIK